VTSATNETPTRRAMASRVGLRLEEYIVELGASEITIRPKGTRRGGPAEVTFSVSAIYERCLMARVHQDAKPKRVKRSLI
jgi:hypothetical protein